MSSRISCAPVTLRLIYTSKKHVDGPHGYAMLLCWYSGLGRHICTSSWICCAPVLLLFPGKSMLICFHGYTVLLCWYSCLGRHIFMSTWVCCASVCLCLGKASWCVFCDTLCSCAVPLSWAGMVTCPSGYAVLLTGIKDLDQMPTIHSV